MAAPEVHQCGGDSTPNPTNQQQECFSMGEKEIVRLPLKASRTARMSLHHEKRGRPEQNCCMWADDAAC
jgi:hypothetical protein